MSFYLFIMRHAKSDYSVTELSDFDRPINKRGKKNAARIGKWMQDNDHIPQRIISSPAQRAKQTAEQVITRISGFDKEDIHYDNELYLADFNTLRQCIRSHKKTCHSLMLIAHNPGLEYLVDYLSGQSIQADSKGKIFTTANLAIFEYADNDFDLMPDKGNLIEFIRPGELSDSTNNG